MGAHGNVGIYMNEKNLIKKMVDEMMRTKQACAGGVGGRRIFVWTYIYDEKLLMTNTHESLVDNFSIRLLGIFHF